MLEAIVTEIQVLDIHISTYEPDIVSFELNVALLETEANETKKTQKLELLLSIAAFVMGVCLRKCRGRL